MKDRFTITVEATAGDPAGRTPEARLKGALKLLLQAFGHRCLGLKSGYGTPISSTEEPAVTPTG